MNTKRTAKEQQLWDHIATQIVFDCFRRQSKPEGCAHVARDVADAVLAERRASQKQDQGK